MRTPRFHFILGPFLELIAVLAVCFALIRMPFGPIVLDIGLVLAGFAIDRARCGAGFLGGVLAGLIGHLSLGVAQRVTHQALFDEPSALMLGWTLRVLMVYALIGAAWGGFVSIPAWMVVSVNRSWSGEGPEDDLPDGQTSLSNFESHHPALVQPGEPPS